MAIYDASCLPCCGCDIPECDACDSKTTPSGVRLNFANVAAKDPLDCVDWDDWNQEHIVPNTIAECNFFGENADSGHTYPHSQTIPCNGAIEMYFDVVGAGVACITVNVFENNGFMTAVFYREFTTATIDCLDEYEIPLITNNDVASDWGNATCTVEGFVFNHALCSVCSNDTPFILRMELDAVGNGSEYGSTMNAIWPLVQTGECEWELTDTSLLPPSGVTGISMELGVYEGNAWAEITIFTDTGEATFTLDTSSPTLNCKDLGYFELGDVSDTCYTWTNATCHVYC